MQQNRLLSYGDSIVTYHGEGTLTLSNEKVIQCQFETEQLKSGAIFLICDFSSTNYFDLLVTPPVIVQRFDGITSQGLSISSRGNILWLDIKSRIESSSQPVSWGVFRVSEMTIDENIQPRSVRFGITNFIGSDSFQVSLQHDSNVVTLSFEPLKDHETIENRLRRLKGIDVSYEVIGTFSTDQERKILEEVIDNVCYLLSVARGTTIQWVYRDLYDESGNRVSRTHASRVTKTYCSLLLLRNTKDIQNFLEKTYTTFVANKDHYFRLILAYIDAKHENDYLEIRGIKLAATIEAVKSVFLKLQYLACNEFILESEKFNQLSKKVQKFISQELKVTKTDKAERAALYEKISDLNRRPFREILIELLKYIDLNVSKEDLNLFVACRNSLVHQGKFYCESATDQERKKITPLPTGIDEYYFLVHFVDTIFLRLLGYSGSYFDHSSPGSPVWKKLI